MGPNGEEVDTACIVTTVANRTLAPIHDRMPVVIAPAAFDLWLDGANVDAATAAALIAPAPESLFEAHAISTAVNRTANDSPALIEPLPPDVMGDEPAAAPVPARAAARPPVKAKPKKNDGQASLL
jgi:putative SOS response-associated peptidase YedK